MLRGDCRLKLDSGAVAAEVIDGEAIMINLANATYYSIAGVGAFIWELLVERCSLDEIAS